MIEEIENEKVRVVPSDWRWSATVVGLEKYLKHYELNYNIHDEYLEFSKSDIDDEKYLLFAEKHFAENMHHVIVEDLIEVNNPSEDQIKLVNDKLSKNTSSNSVMNRTFKDVKYDSNNSNAIKEIIEKNRTELIKQTFKGGRALYYNFCNENNMLSESGNSCRLRGYSVDMGKKSKSLAFARDKNTTVNVDSKYFDFIPFAFSKTREAFFINNNFTVQQLIHSNKNDLSNIDDNIRSKLFFKVKNSSAYIDYDVEVIRKDRDSDFYETIFLKKDAISIFEKVEENTLKAITSPCKINTMFADANPGNGNENWLKTEKIVVDSIINNIKLDFLIDGLLKLGDKNYLISHLIKINQLIYKEDQKMTELQKRAYGSAMEVKKILSGNKSNKLRAYEQRLISAITLKDYDRVQEILLHLSAFTQVQMSFLIELFEDFEKNKNLAYTFINMLGEKKQIEKKGE